MNDEYVTIEEMADMHGVAPNTIRRIIWADQERPEDERRIPGAFKVGSKYRGLWQIPIESAKAWERSPAGRPSAGDEPEE